jgi:hypothetical protein
MVVAASEAVKTLDCKGSGYPATRSSSSRLCGTPIAMCTSARAPRGMSLRAAVTGPRASEHKAQHRDSVIAAPDRLTPLSRGPVRHQDPRVRLRHAP